MTLAEGIQLVGEDQLAFYALPIFFLVIIGEAWISKHEQKNLYERKDFIASMWMLFLTAVVEFIPKALAFIAFFYLHSVSPFAEVVGRQWWAWIVLFFLDDFAYYWFHRMNHEVRLFWAGHVPHHSSQRMNYGTALRQGVGERVHKYLFWLWLPLLGFDALMIFVIMSVNLIYQFWVHTELVDRMPAWFEYIFNTPSHHRVHHASNIRYLDCNHAGVFILWDRIFGTFSPELAAEPVKYGLTTNIDTYNPIKVAGHEYAAIWNDVLRADKWSDKLNYIFKSPGWSHDGKDRRAKVLRKEMGVEL